MVSPRVEDEPCDEGEEEDQRLLHNYCSTAGDNERRLAAELARDSLVALVPCKEMARGSGALGSCTEVARDSVVALWSAAWNSRVNQVRDCSMEFARKSSRRLVSEKNGERGVIKYSICCSSVSIYSLLFVVVAILVTIFTCALCSIPI